MSGFVQMVEGILLSQVQKTGNGVRFSQRQFFSESRFWWGWDYSCCMIFFVFSEESCHMAQSGLEVKTSVIGYDALLRFF